jgi:hypothetical protein
VVDYKGEALLSSYVYVNPKNVVDYITRSECPFNRADEEEGGIKAASTIARW